MSSLNGSPLSALEELVVILGLTMVHDLLPRSKYPEEVQRELGEIAKALIDKLQSRPQGPTHDAYGNPHQP